MVKKHRVTGQPTVEIYPLGVERRAVGRFMLGNDYEANVNAQRERENKDADFVVAGLWVSKKHPEGAGRHVEGLPALVRHVDTSEEYVCCRPHQTKSGKIVKEHDEWIDVATGKKLSAAQVEDLKINLLDKVSASKKQDLDKEIPVRCIHVENVKAACYGKWFGIVS